VGDLSGSLPSQTLAHAVFADFERISTLRATQLDTALQHACEQLRTKLPAWTFEPPRGGHSLWLRLPEGNAEAFAQTALKHGVTVIPGPLLSPTRDWGDHLRLQFLQPPQLINKGIDRLAEAWRDYTQHSQRLGVLV
jgi:DNA-binding transcriptional MocR family regulator